MLRIPLSEKMMELFAYANNLYQPSVIENSLQQQMFSLRDDFVDSSCLLFHSMDLISFLLFISKSCLWPWWLSIKSFFPFEVLLTKSNGIKTQHKSHYQTIFVFLWNLMTFYWHYECFSWIQSCFHLKCAHLKSVDIGLKRHRFSWWNQLKLLFVIQQFSCIALYCIAILIS